VIDETIAEPLGGAHRDPRGMATTVKSYISRQLRGLINRPAAELLDARYAKFRQMGVLS
jgi:acetyl-CoA carboxylase carboxyl transferase subunit alpha